MYEELSGIGRVSGLGDEPAAKVAYSIVITKGRATHRGAIIVIDGNKDLTKQAALVLHLADGRQVSFKIVSGDPYVGDYAIQVNRLEETP